MKTITAEEYKKLYGETGYTSLKALTPTPKNSTAKDVGIGFAKAGVETIRGLADMGEWIGSQTAGRINNAQMGKGFTPSEFRPNLLSGINTEARNPAQMVGKGLEFAAEILTPTGLAKKAFVKGIDIAAEFATGARKLATGATKLAADSGATKYAIGRVPKALGIFTGESDDVIRYALKDPKVADLGIESGDAALRKIVAEGADNSIKIRTAFNTAYRDAFGQLIKDQPSKVVSRQQILYNFVDTLKESGVKASNGVLDFTTSKIAANPGEASKIKTAYDAILNWKDFSLQGVVDLKQMVGSLTRFASEGGGTSKSPFLGRLYHSLDEVIKSKLPEKAKATYENLNSNYSNNIELYNDIVDAFNSGDPFSKLATALSKNKDTFRNILEFYEKQSGKSVLPAIAGREMAMEKTAAFGFLNPRSWIDLLVSPKIQAKTVLKVGQKLPK